MPIKSEYAQVEKLVRELALVSQQDGWVPPESMPAKAAWPYFEDDEVLAAAAVLRSGKINQWTGKEVEKFQEEFAAFCGVRHAIALANGSVALDLALYALDIGPGDEVIVTPRTFIASAELRGSPGGEAGFCRCGSGQPEHHRRIDPEGDHPPNAGDHCRSPGGVAVRHGPDPGDCREIWSEGDRGLRPVPRGGILQPVAGAGYSREPRRTHRTGRRPPVPASDGQPGGYGGLFLLPGQDHDHGRRRGDAC